MAIRMIHKQGPHRIKSRPQEPHLHTMMPRDKISKTVFNLQTHIRRCQMVFLDKPRPLIPSDCLIRQAAPTTHRIRAISHSTQHMMSLARQDHTGTLQTTTCLVQLITHSTHKHMVIRRIGHDLSLLSPDTPHLRTINTSRATGVKHIINNHLSSTIMVGSNLEKP